MKARFAIAMAALLAASAWGQSLLEGRVTDPAGKPIPGAELVLKHGDVELRRSTDADGRFSYLALPAGEYELVVSATGFYRAERELAVRPRQPVEVQIALAPTVSAKETVEVRSADIMRCVSCARLRSSRSRGATKSPTAIPIPRC